MCDLDEKFSKSTKNEITLYSYLIRVYANSIFVGFPITMDSRVRISGQTAKKPANSLSLCTILFCPFPTTSIAFLCFSFAVLFTEKSGIKSSRQQA